MADRGWIEQSMPGASQTAHAQGHFAELGGLQDECHPAASVK